MARIAGISARDFAKLEGCSHTAVNKAIVEGRPQALPDGKLDPALVGTGWSAKNRRGTADPNAGPSKAESERRREHVRAELAQIDLDEKLGRVVLVEDVAEAIGARLATVRTKLLALPAEQASTLFRMKSTAELEKKLRSLITAALEGLSGGATVQRGT